MSRHVLVVEDDATLRAALVRRIRRHGHEVRDVGSIEEAEAHLAWTTVVVLDLIMPEAQGEDVLMRWRDHAGIVAISGDDDRLAAVRLAADATLDKPIAAGSLGLAISRAARAWRDRQMAGESASAALPGPLGAVASEAGRAIERVEDPSQRGALRLIYALIVLLVLLAGAAIYGVVRIQRLEDERAVHAAERCDGQIERALAPINRELERCHDRYDEIIRVIQAKGGSPEVTQILTSTAE